MFCDVIANVAIELAWLHLRDRQLQALIRRLEKEIECQSEDHSKSNAPTLTRWTYFSSTWKKHEKHSNKLSRQTHLAHKKRLIQVAVEPVFVYGNVNVDNVALIQRPRIRDSVTNDLEKEWRIKKIQTNKLMCAHEIRIR